MITFEEVLKKLKSGKSLELKFFLNFGVYSRHQLHLQRGLIVDRSLVDESTTKSTIPMYRKSFYGEAFRKSAVELLSL